MRYLVASIWVVALLGIVLTPSRACASDEKEYLGLKFGMAIRQVEKVFREADIKQISPYDSQYHLLLYETPPIQISGIGTCSLWFIDGKLFKIRIKAIGSFSDFKGRLAKRYGQSNCWEIKTDDDRTFFDRLKLKKGVPPGQACNWEDGAVTIQLVEEWGKPFKNPIDGNTHTPHQMNIFYVHNEMKNTAKDGL